MTSLLATAQDFDFENFDKIVQELINDELIDSERVTFIKFLASINCLIYN